MKTVWFVTIGLAGGMLVADDSVDDALKKGDYNTIMSILKRKLPDPAPVRPAAEVKSAAPAKADPRANLPRPGPSREAFTESATTGAAAVAPPAAPPSAPPAAAKTGRPNLHDLLETTRREAAPPPPAATAKPPPIAKRTPPDPAPKARPATIEIPAPAALPPAVPPPAAPAAPPPAAVAKPETAPPAWPDPNRVAVAAAETAHPGASLTRNQTGDAFNQNELENINASIEQELEAARAQAEAQSEAARRRMNRITNSAPPKARPASLVSRLFKADRRSAEPAALEPVRKTMDVPAPAPAAGEGARRFDHFSVNRAALDELLKSTRSATAQFRDEAASQGGSAFIDTLQEDDSWKASGPDAWKYDGDWQGGLMHGYGKLTYADGWEYVGTWNRGKMDGQGRLTYADGSTYAGSFRAGAIDGMGRLTYPDGWSFLGEFRGGRISGRGVLTHPGSR